MPPCSSDCRVKLAGEYMTPGRPFRPFVLTSLSQGRCRARMSGSAPSLGTEIVMWIGAIGPLAATVHGCKSDEVEMAFLTPLANAVVDHFASL